MDEKESKDLLTRLADAGEEAFQRLADAAGADRVTGVLNSTRDRLDEMQRKVRGIEALERRVSELEQRLDKLEGKKPAAEKPKPAARKTSTAKKTGSGSARAGTAKAEAKPSSSGSTGK